MGTDIHLYIETLQNGEWKHLNWEKQYETGEYYSDGTPRLDYRQIFESPLWVSRNYNLFSVLADVRNGTGFAGVPTSNGFRPIDKPRGLPSDVSVEIGSQYSEDWAHDATWLMLREVVEYDYDQTVTLVGVVDEKTYSQFKEAGEPPISWSGGVWGSTIRNVENKELDDIMSGKLDREEGAEYYTSISWQRTYREAIGKWWFETMEYIQENIGGLDNVRLVMWFDS